MSQTLKTTAALLGCRWSVIILGLSGVLLTFSTISRDVWQFRDMGSSVARDEMIQTSQSSDMRDPQPVNCSDFQEGLKPEERNTSQDNQTIKQLGSTYQKTSERDSSVETEDGPVLLNDKTTKDINHKESKKQLLSSQDLSEKNINKTSLSKASSSEQVLLSNMSQVDPKLIAFIKDNIDPPSPETGIPTRKTDYSEQGQSEYVDKLLKGRTNGFFLECGAAGGRDMSNTFFFEKERDWTGLLIEADPDEYRELLKVKRGAYSIHGCLSPKNKTEVLRFSAQGTLGQLEGSWPHNVAGKKAMQIQVQCYPLYSILLALGITHIDYFSLDVEGAELEILRTIPFNALTIDVFTIECLSYNTDLPTMKKLDLLKAFFNQLGNYEFVGVLPNDKSPLDAVFARKEVL